MNRLDIIDVNGSGRFIAIKNNSDAALIVRKAEDFPGLARKSRATRGAKRTHFDALPNSKFGLRVSCALIVQGFWVLVWHGGGNAIEVVVEVNTVKRRWSVRYPTVDLLDPFWSFRMQPAEPLQARRPTMVPMGVKLIFDRMSEATFSCRNAYEF